MGEKGKEEKTGKKKRKLWQKLLIVAICIVLAFVAIFAIIIGILYSTEYRPNEVESIGVECVLEDCVPSGEPISLMTYNIGYGALGDNADFFMDGGTHVNTASRERINSNMDGIINETKNLDPDFVFYQEVDQDSHRSKHINEELELEVAFPEYETAFAYNFRVWFIPYPIPPIGKVDAGILTMSRYEIAAAERIQLPCPFTGIERLGNLKRCLLVSHVPVEDSDKELVLVNLHLEAYDSGEGKIAQTAMLREVLQEEYEKGNYVIAGGDFNQTFSNVDTSAYPTYPDRWQPGVIDVNDLPEGWQYVMDNHTPTCRSLDQPYVDADPKTFQYYMIDGFILSPNVKLLDVQTQNLQFVCADHNPVLMQVELIEEDED